MDLFGRHKISLESIRRLAIECHSLDAAAHELLVDTTVAEPQDIKATYEELFSEKLLALAVGIRTIFYQGVPSGGTEKYVGHCGFLFTYKSNKEAIKAFSIKDLCDKIIHAHSVSRDMADGTRKPITILSGKLNSESWQLQFSSALFCEGVLNWIKATEAVVS